MFYRWTLLMFLLFILGIMIEANSLPTVETFNPQLKFLSAAAASDNLDEDAECSLIVSRGDDLLTSTQTDTGHYREITVTVTAFNETFVMDLKLNTYLFASTYIEKSITNSGEIYNDVNHVTDHCYYTGVAMNRSHSTAAVSTCKGITGYIAIGNVSYHIEPKGNDLKGRHRVFRNIDDVKTNFRCGTKGELEWMRNNDSTLSSKHSSHRMKRSFLYPQDRDSIDKVVEVYVANDNSQYRSRSSNVQDVYRRTKDIVNIASLAYQPLGIYLVLVGVEVWTGGDKFSIRDSNVDGAVDSWYTYRRTSVIPFYYNDNGILITNVAFYGGVVGKTIPGSMCSNQFSGSIISDVSYQAADAGMALAHEMGHSFGLMHDDIFADCTCEDPDSHNQCIMRSYTDSSERPATKWSSCSLDQFATSFNHGMDICLYNIPQTIFQPSSSCGNGIVDDGEQCDCGNAPNSECNAACCIGATCQLTSSATCASGRCCDISSCRIKSSGTECRSKSNDCDLSESCNGVDARCPIDGYRPDGTDCTNIVSAYCYQGQCRNHQSQCELLWGPGTNASDDVCYTRYNVMGKFWGNCGGRWMTAGLEYIACDVKDVMCGMLFCQDNKRALSYYKKPNWDSKSTIGSSSCRSVDFDFGIRVQDPGLVPNGAKCGDRQMCVNQKCVNVTVPRDAASTTSSTISTTTSTSSVLTTPTASNPTTSTSRASITLTASNPTTSTSRSRMTPRLTTTTSSVSSQSQNSANDSTKTKRQTPALTRP